MIAALVQVQLAVRKMLLPKLKLSVGKVILLLLLLVTALAWQHYSEQWLTLSNLKNHQLQLNALLEAHYYHCCLIFIGICFMLTALSLPGSAVMMSLVAGALFGFCCGTLMVLFASSLGALFAFWISRFVLRDWLRKGFSHHYQKVDQGLQKEGASYLLTLRLLPIIPFVVLNLVMGLTSIPARRYYVWSLPGILPGVMVYVNAGTQLANLQKPSDILTPQVLTALLLLGILPLLCRKGVQKVKGLALHGKA